MRKFTVPCEFGDRRAPFDCYVGLPAEGKHPLHYQARWLARERGGKIPGDVMESFAKLLVLAKENDVSYEELCVHALQAADEQKRKQEEKGSES